MTESTHRTHHHHIRLPFQVPDFSIQSFIPHELSLGISYEEILTRLHHCLQEINNDRTLLCERDYKSLVGEVDEFHQVEAILNQDCLILPKLLQSIKNEQDQIEEKLQIFQKKDMEMQKILLEQMLREIKEKLQFNLDKIQSLSDIAVFDDDYVILYNFLESYHFSYHQVKIVQKKCHSLDISILDMESTLMTSKDYILRKLNESFFSLIQRLPLESHATELYIIQKYLTLFEVEHWNEDLLAHWAHVWIKPTLLQIIDKSKYTEYELEYYQSNFASEMAFQRIVCDIKNSVFQSPSFTQLMESIKICYASTLAVQFILMIFKEFSDLILSQISVIFAVNSTQLFHANFMTLSNFIDYLSSLLPRVDKHALRSSLSFQLLFNKWQLSPYYQLVCKDIIMEYESVIGSSTLNLSLFKNSNHRSSVYMALMKALNQTWSQEVYIGTLAPRFWKLTLQCIVRYCKWSKHIIQKSHLLSDVDQDDKLTLWSNLYDEISQMENEIKRLFSEKIRFWLDRYTKNSHLVDALDDAFALIKSLMPPLQEIIIKPFMQKILSSLFYLRTLPNSLKNQNPSPESPNPSGYVKEVSLIVGLLKDKHLSEDRISYKCRQTILTAILEKIFKAYKGMVMDLFSSYMKLNKESSNGLLGSLESSSNPSPPFDSLIARLKNQITLDMTHLKHELLERIGTDATDFPISHTIDELINVTKSC